MYRAYWTHSGLSSPYSFLMLARAAALACGPAIRRAGSPGATRERKKVIRVTPHRTNRTNSSRRRISRFIRLARTHPLDSA